MSDNEQRDELAEVIAYEADKHHGFECGSLPPAEQDLKLADAILVAGYRKPRTITTAKELDALPDWSAILDGSGDVGQKVGGWWHFPETAPMGSSKVAKYGPATVIHEPTTEATQ